MHSLLALALFIASAVALQPVFRSSANGGSEGQPLVPLSDEEEASNNDMQEFCERYPWIEQCTGATMEKRKSAYMRFGRSAPSDISMGSDALAFENFEKRKSAYMRFGKRSPTGQDDEVAEAGPEMAKRKSAYMRFGKRKSAYMRFGKRSADVVSSEASPVGAAEKRKSAYMRFGRR